MAWNLETYQWMIICEEAMYCTLRVGKFKQIETAKFCNDYRTCILNPFCKVAFAMDSLTKCLFHIRNVITAAMYFIAEFWMVGSSHSQSLWIITNYRDEYRVSSRVIAYCVLRHKRSLHGRWLRHVCVIRHAVIWTTQHARSVLQVNCNRWSFGKHLFK